MDRSKNIGFIGLGSMGEGMALNLAKKNFSLVLFDINKDKYESSSDYGCTIVNSSAEVIKNASTIFTVLPGPKEVEEVILDSDGIIDNSNPGDLIVDFSTVLPETSDNLFNACKSKEVSFVDSPIGRLAKNAWDVSSMFMIGAKEEDLSRIKPFLEAMGTTLSSLWGTRSWYKN
jgi:3-hydroxyisobutyrate dehydrogenase-like beta-hydroxyacid dehydrogenase